MFLSFDFFNKKKKETKRKKALEAHLYALTPQRSGTPLSNTHIYLSDRLTAHLLVYLASQRSIQSRPTQLDTLEIAAYSVSVTHLKLSPYFSSQTFFHQIKIHSALR